MRKAKTSTGENPSPGIPQNFREPVEGSSIPSQAAPESPIYSPAQRVSGPVFHTSGPAEAVFVPSTVKTAEKTALSGTLWTWSHSKIKKVRYNKRVAKWMEYDPEFANWVKACLMVHAENGLFESKCLIPDQWREDVGRRITIVTADALPAVRAGGMLQLESGVFHVLS